MANGPSGISEELNRFWDSSGFAEELSDDIKTGRDADPRRGTFGFIANQLLGFARQVFLNFADVEDGLSREVQESFLKFMTDAGLPEETVARLRTLLDNVTTEVPGVQIILSLMAWLQLMVSTVGGTSAVLSEIVRRPAIIALRPGLGGIDDLLANDRIFGEEFTDRDLRYGELGIPDEWRDIITEARTQTLDVATLIEAFHRGIFDEGLFDDHILRLGFGLPADQEAWQQLRHPRLNFEQLVRARYRGFLTKEAFDEQKALYGYIDETLTNFEALQRPLIGTGEAVELFRRNKLLDRKDTIAPENQKAFDPETGDNAQTTLKGLLGQLGFDDEVIGQIATLAERLPTVQELFELWRKFHIEDPELLKSLTDLGMTTKLATQISDLKFFEATPADLVQFGVKDAFDPQVVSTFGQDQENPRNANQVGRAVADSFNDSLRRSGLRPEAWDLNWISHWRIPAPGQGFDMFHRGIISGGELDVLLKALDFPPFWRPRVRDLSFRLIPRRTLALLVAAGIISDQAAGTKFRELGFTSGDASLMLEEASARATQDLRSQTKSDIVNAFERGLITAFEARNNLRDINLSSKAINLILAQANLNIAEQRGVVSIEEDRLAARQARDKTQRDILRALANGLVSKERATSDLTTLGFSQLSADALVSCRLLERELDDLDRTLDQFQLMFRARVIDTDELQRRIVEIGIGPIEINRLITLFTLERERVERIAAKRDRKPTRTDLNDWLKKGVIDVDNWQTSMADLGYGDQLILNYLNEVLIDTKAI